MRSSPMRISAHLRGIDHLLVLQHLLRYSVRGSTGEAADSLDGPMRHPVVSLQSKISVRVVGTQSSFLLKMENCADRGLTSA